MWGKRHIWNIKGKIFSILHSFWEEPEKSPVIMFKSLRSENILFIFAGFGYVEVPAQNQIIHSILLHLQ